MAYFPGVLRPDMEPNLHGWIGRIFGEEKFKLLLFSIFDSNLAFMRTALYRASGLASRSPRS